jgi:site-specific recombinase XerD
VDLQFSLEAIAKKALEVERGRMLRGELALQSFKSLRSRFMRKIYPFFQDKDIRTISHKDLAVFVKSLSDSLASTVTISQYMQSVRLIFKFALVNNLVDKIPPFPKIKIDSQPRGGFTASEYLRLLRVAKSLAKLTEEEKPWYA